MAVSIDDIKKLKELTGVGLTGAKKALQDADGNFDKALEEMRIKGLAKAEKKSDREAGAGIVHAYVHGGKIGVLVELNCETDFVARTDDFKIVANDIALHIAATSPKYLNVADIPEADVSKERELIAAELKEQGKPAEMAEKITEGKIKKWYSEVVLMQQAFVKNPDQTIENLVKEAIAKLGENIVLSNYSRIELGN
ncbi:elongation factor Ts [Candidatus Saccharibacteria bacterium]|jgi:elongation factor Ts|nr:elongation factor Ts [Candidatus Saccharibacteria bacterium]MBP9131729.1 elongation factor Ts [Candidatus Saccharibacteria bacterium]